MADETDSISIEGSQDKVAQKQDESGQKTAVGSLKKDGVYVCPYCPYTSPHSLGVLAHLRFNHREEFDAHFRQKPLSKEIIAKKAVIEKKGDYGTGIGYKENIRPNEEGGVVVSYKEKPPLKLLPVQEVEEEPIVAPFEKKIQTKHNITLSGKQLHMAELLISNGFARDLSELQNKSIQLAYSLLNIGTLSNNQNLLNGQEESPMKKPNVQELLQDIHARELEEVQIEMLKSKLNQRTNGGGKNMDMGEALLMMTIMQNNKGGDNSNMLQMLELMKALQNNQAPREQMGVREMIDIAKTLQPPQQPQNDFRQQLELIKAMTENKGDKESVTDVIRAMNEKSKEEHEKQIQLQQLRDEHYKELMQMKIEQLQNQLSNKGGNDLSTIRETVSQIRAINEELGGKKETGMLDYIESLGRNLGPVVTEVLKTKNAARATTPDPQAYGQQRFSQASPQFDENGQEFVEGQTEQPVVAIPEKPKEFFKTDPSKKITRLIPSTGPELPTRNMDYVG